MSTPTTPGAGNPLPPAVAGEPPAAKAGQFLDPGAARAAVSEYYQSWSKQLTDRSFELSIGLIGANWAVFGGVAKIMSNRWAQGSIAVVVVGLLATLLATWVLTELLRMQVHYALADPARWRSEWEDKGGKLNEWPYTTTIEVVGNVQRLIKAVVPIIGGVLFFLALLSP
jgi:hypothetical protein